MSEPRLRPAVRAVILDPAGRTLLVRFAFPDRVVWACPGGGMEPGESTRDTIIRELAEETGLVITDPGPPVWIRTHVISLFGGAWDGQRETFYLVRTEAFEPSPHFSVEALEAEYVAGLRWWTAAELAAAEADGVVFAPRTLPSLLDAAAPRGRPLRATRRRVSRPAPGGRSAPNARMHGIRRVQNAPRGHGRPAAERGSATQVEARGSPARLRSPFGAFGAFGEIPGRIVPGYRASGAFRCAAAGEVPGRGPLRR